MKYSFIFLLGVFASLAGFAQANDVEKNCTEFRNTVLDIHYYRQFFSPGTCFLDFVPMSQNNMVYRSFLASNEGVFMVFNSYGPGEDAVTTGARVFYFFPRTMMPDAVASDKTVTVKTASPLAEFVMDATQSRLLSMVGGQISEDPKIHDGNKGGVEIKKHQGLMLDLGFALGHDPSSEPDRKVFFEDANNVRCTVKNSELFKYDGSGNNNLLFSSDLELSKFLKKRCPQLLVDF